MVEVIGVEEAEEAVEEAVVDAAEVVVVEAVSSLPPSGHEILPKLMV